MKWILLIVAAMVIGRLIWVERLGYSGHGMPIPVIPPGYEATINPFTAEYTVRPAAGFHYWFLRARYALIFSWFDSVDV